MAICQMGVRQEGNKVIVIKDGRVVFDFHHSAAMELARAIVIKAKMAEEWDNKDKLVIDQAILLRSGSSLPLAIDPRIRKEALKESRWNRMLRRFMPVSKPMPEKIGHLQVKRG